MVKVIKIWFSKIKLHCLCWFYMLEIVSKEKQNHIILRGLFLHKRSATEILAAMVMEDYTFHCKGQAAYHPVPQIASHILLVWSLVFVA